MIIRCWRCRERYVAADRPGERDRRCPSCDAPRARSDRRCAIADRLAMEVPCPIGGCHLARLLGAPLLSSPGDPCPVERIALHQPDNPLVLNALEDLRRELEGTGGPHVHRVGGPALIRVERPVNRTAPCRVGRLQVGVRRGLHA